MQASFFLNRLGLDQAADERAVKRAYARELKQIDQETDAAGFQSLRQAYEMALHWVKHKPALSFAPAQVVRVVPVVSAVCAGPLAAPAPEPVQLAPAAAGAPLRDADSGADPVQLAHEVFEGFLAACADMAAHGKARDLVMWRKQLQDCASDERLLNLSARAHFEFFVARLLANGWRSGHEGLFVAARQLFGWEKDRRRLMEFGQLGGLLNQAIDEAEVFTQQHSAECSGQADALARVREDCAPGAGELLTHVPHLRTLVVRFPAWTGVIASSERIEQWTALERDIPAWRRRLRWRPRLVKPASDGGTASGGWWKFFLVLGLIRAVIALSGSSHAPAPSQPPPWNPPRIEQPASPWSPQEFDAEEEYRRAAGKFYIQPGRRAPDPYQLPAAPHASLAPPGRALNDAEMKAISERVRFNSPHAAPGTYRAEFAIALNEDGAIASLTKTKASGLPLLDQHVEDALRESAPFGKQIRRHFSLFYTWRRMPKPQESGDSAPPAGNREEPEPRAGLPADSPD